MAAFCLHPDAVNAFRRALADGTLDPDKLTDMTSEERRNLFAPIVGEENAPHVNALLESKLLQKNQIHGMTQWATQVAGLKPEVRRDLLSRIQRIDHLLTPADQKAFLEDHIKQRLGVGVTMDQAKKISAIGKRASDAQREMLANRALDEKNGLSPWAPSKQTLDSQVKYGESVIDMTDYVDSLKPDNRTFFQKFSDAANIPRTILTLGHTSAPLVQGWGMITTKQGAAATIHQFRYLMSEAGYRHDMAAMIGDPHYNDWVKGGMSITNLGRNLSQREEAIQSSYVEQFNRALQQGANKLGIPLPNIARAGSRAFTGYQNYVRYWRATDLLKAHEMAGGNISPGSPIYEQISTIVNNFTGRGSLGGGGLETAAPLLNTIFFAPRKIAGTMQMFNPVNYVNPRISSTGRIAMVRQLGGSLIATAAVLGMATAMGFKVSTNPIDAKFGKIQLPDGGAIDVTGGNDIYVRLLARLMSNQEVTAKGRQLTLGVGQADTRLSLIGKFLRNKLAPMPATIFNSFTGTDPTGHPFDPMQEVKDKFIPIAFQSFFNLAHAIPQDYAALAFIPFVALGAGVEPPFVAPPRHRMTGMSTRHG